MKNSKPMNVCARIKRSMQRRKILYEEVAQRLEKAGFKLDEYGGELIPYARYTHQDGVVANIEYRFLKRPGTKDSWDADGVTDFYYYEDN